MLFYSIPPYQIYIFGGSLPAVLSAESFGESYIFRKWLIDEGQRGAEGGVAQEGGSVLCLECRERVGGAVSGSKWHL